MEETCDVLLTCNGVLLADRLAGVDAHLHTQASEWTVASGLPSDLFDGSV